MKTTRFYENCTSASVKWAQNPYHLQGAVCCTVSSYYPLSDNDRSTNMTWEIVNRQKKNKAKSIHPR